MHQRPQSMHAPRSVANCVCEMMERWRENGRVVCLQNEGSREGREVVERPSSAPCHEHPPALRRRNAKLNLF